MLRITLEADYALRIIYNFTKHKTKLDAKTISENVGVSLRFTLKILRKLMLSGIIKSYKGTAGGYDLAKKPSEISMYDVIVSIDGPVEVNRCISENYQCARPGVSTSKCCPIHHVFQDINEIVKENLQKATFDKFM